MKSKHHSYRRALAGIADAEQDAISRQLDAAFPGDSAERGVRAMYAERGEVMPAASSPSSYGAPPKTALKPSAFSNISPLKIAAVAGGIAFVVTVAGQLLARRRR